MASRKATFSLHPITPTVLIEPMPEYTRVAEHLFIREKTGRYYAIIKKNNRIRRLSLKTKVRDIANSRLFDFRLSLGASPSEVARHKDTMIRF